MSFIANRSSCLVIIFALSNFAVGQGVQQARYQAPGGQQRTPVATPALQYFGGHKLTIAPAPRPRTALPTPQPVQLSGGKPFQAVSRPPSLSPYMGLDMLESDVGLPNYYAYTRPQIQQRQANAAQQAQLRRLQQQMRMANATGVVSRNPSGGIPTTGHSSQFLNMGGYYPTLR